MTTKLQSGQSQYDSSILVTWLSVRYQFTNLKQYHNENNVWTTNVNKNKRENFFKNPEFKKKTNEIPVHKTGP